MRVIAINKKKCKWGNICVSFYHGKDMQLILLEICVL